MTLQPGQILGDRYRIVKHLAEGGMGAVYRAWDMRLKVPVALKEMTPLAGQSLELLNKLREQFSQEATILAQLNHPNLVRVGDYFQENDNVYLVMDYVVGENLAQIIETKGAIPEPQMLEWTRQLLDALTYCHSKGVVHRDIKPQNIIIRSDGAAILVDFGLVKLWNPADPRTKTVMRGMGTPEYAPPEQYDTGIGHTDPRSDLYSLGACLYHALTGQAPPTATQRIAGTQAFVPPRRVNGNLSPGTEVVILRAMELQVDRRFPNALTMTRALNNLNVTKTVETYRNVQAHTKVMPQQQAVIKAEPVKKEFFIPDTRISNTLQGTPDKKRNRKWLPWLLGAAGLTTVFAVVFGCWLIGQLSKSGADSVATSTMTIVEEGVTATPAIVTSVPDSVLNIIVPNSLSVFGDIDPIMSSWNRLSLQVASESWVGLTRQDETTLKVHPGMADHWDVEDDGATWIFSIRSDIPWVRFDVETEQVELVLDDSGKVRYVTAHDFAYGLKRLIQDPDSSYGILFSQLFDDDLNSSIEVVDDTTLKIKLNSPSGSFDVMMDRYGFALPSRAIEIYGNGWTDPRYIQSYGPYILIARQVDEYLILLRNPHWTGTENIPVPAIKEIAWWIEDDEIAFAAYKAGDFGRMYVPYAILPTIWESDQDKHSLSSVSNGCVFYYELNTAKAPFDFATSRLAFLLATDKVQVIEKTFGNGPRPAFWFSTNNVRGGIAFDNPGIPALSYDSSSAIALLDQTYPDRSKIPVIEIGYISSYTTHKTRATEIKRQWENTLGVNVELIEYSDYEEMTQIDPPHIHFNGWCEDYNDVQTFYDVHERISPMVVRTGWYDAEFMKLIEDAGVSTDQEERLSLYASAEEILVNKEAVILPLYEHQLYYITQPYVQVPENNLTRVERYEKWTISEH